jgi:hypothetical protein
MMKPKYGFAIATLALAGGLALSPVVFAQQAAPGSSSADITAITPTSPDSAPAPAASSDSNDSAKQSFKSSMGEAAENTEQGAKVAYHKSRTALKDTVVTAKAKAALEENKNTASAASAIHVDTEHGVVTLSGDVDSPTVARRATEVVARLTGVKRVVSALTTAPAPGPEANGSRTD